MLVSSIREKTEELISAVANEITDPLDRLKTAEQWLPNLLELKPSQYKTFVSITRQLMEQDEDITLFEYALNKSVTRRLEPKFAAGEKAPVRYEDMSLITTQIALVLSRLAQAEATPADTATAAFEEGVAALEHRPSTDFVMLPNEQCDLASFDEALDEIALASVPVKRNILDACSKLVVMGNDFTYDQALLVASVADTFKLPRPDWI